MSKKKRVVPCMNGCTDHFMVGERVAVIRHEHGWEDGNLEGTIAVVVCSPQSKSVHYTVATDHGEVYCRRRDVARP